MVPTFESTRRAATNANVATDRAPTRAALRPDVVTGPHVCVAGACEASGGLSLDGPPAVVLRAAVGREVDLVYRYRFDPGAEPFDFFRVALVSQVGASRPRPRLFQALSRKHLTSPLVGYLHHRYVFDEPGVYEGSFALRAELIAQAKGATDVLDWQAKSVTGDVRINVGATGPVTL